MEPDKLIEAVIAARSAATTANNDVRNPTLLKLKHFAEGEQIGPNLEYYPGLVPDDATERNQLKKRLIVIALIGPILNRYTSHILGRDPEWTATPQGAKAPLKPDDDRVSALSAWHTGAGRVHAELKRADEFMRWGGRSYLHMYVPDVYRVILGKPELARDAADTADALERIRLDALDATQAGVIEVDGVPLAYWRAYSVTGPDGKAQNRVDVHTRQEITVYAEESGKLSPVGQPRENPLYDPARPLRFRALIHEMKREAGPQVTQSDIDLQNGVNTTAGNVIRNNNLGGWRQYYTTDAAQPKDPVTGEKTAYTFGPARVVDIQSDFLRDNEGNPVPGPDGMPVMLKASVGTFDPVNSTFMREDADWLELKLLSRFNQTWVVQGEANVSGESKRESRAAFDKSLPSEAQPAQQALRWIIETADAFAQWVQGKDTLEWLTVTARLFTDTDKVDLATLQHLDAMHTAGKLSLETLLESVPGVDNVEAELKRIQAERATNPAALNALRELGWDAGDWLTAMQRLGYPVSSEAIQSARDMTAGAPALAGGGEDDADEQADVPGA